MLATSSQLAEVVAAALGGHRTSLSAEHGGRWQLGLFEEIIGQRQGSAEQFAAPSRTVLWQIGCGEDMICFGNQLVKRSQFAFVG